MFISKAGSIRKNKNYIYIKIKKINNTLKLRYEIKTTRYGKDYLKNKYWYSLVEITVN
jgi:hypothetical protein